MALPRTLIDPKLIYMEPAVRDYQRGRHNRAYAIFISRLTVFDWFCGSFGRLRCFTLP
jgi:hypothetical protein